jgi:1-acyl-sn-glycerol-3-phosphate acyltransferase
MSNEQVRSALRVVATSLRVCVPTLWESVTGRVARSTLDARLKTWSHTMLNDLRVRVEIQGTENLEPHEPLVVMANHQSHYDIPVLYHVLHGTVRMVAKRELFLIPIFGQALRVGEFIEVDRSNRAKAIHNLREARKLIQSGISVFIAPEGTRSLDGTLNPFKKGGFVLAEDAGVSILPITIDGTRHVLPAQTTRFGFDKTVRVTVHPRISRTQVSSREHWIERVRAAIASTLPNP